MKIISTTKIVIQGVFWASFFNILLKLTGIVSAVLVLGHLSVAEYGLSELAISIVSIFSIFLLPGITPVIVSDVSKLVGENKLSQSKELLKNFFFSQTILSIVAFLFLITLGIISTHFFTPNVAHSIIILSFGFIFAPFRSLFIIEAGVFKNFFLQNLPGVLDEVFRIVFIIILFSFSDLRLEGVFLASILGQFLTIIILGILFSKLHKNFKNILASKSESVWAFIFKHGKWGVLSSYFNTFGQAIRLWVIKFLLGTEAVSIFSLASTLLNHTQSILSLTNILPPILSENISDEKKVYAIIHKSIKYQLITFLAIGGACFFFVPILVEYLFPKYISSIFLYKILLITLIPAAFAVVFTPMFHAKKLQKELFYAINLKNLSIAIFSFIFIPVFGIMGSAIEYLFTLTFFVIERFYFLKRHYLNLNINIRNLFLYDELDKVILSRVLKKIRIILFHKG